jgi:hypothetical protein
MPLFGQGTDGNIENASKADERHQGGLALGALELDKVQAATADLGGEPILGEPGGGAVAPQLPGESGEQLGPLVRVAVAPGARPRCTSRRRSDPGSRSSGTLRPLRSV